MIFVHFPEFIERSEVKARTKHEVDLSLSLFTRDVACFQIKAMFINTTRKRQDTRSFNKIKDCLIGLLELALDGEKL